MGPLIDASTTTQEYEKNINVTLKRYISIISSYILDIAENKGGLMVFVKSHIPLRRLKDFKVPSNIQVIPFEINPRKEKFLVASTYNAPSQKDKYFPWYLRNLLEFYSTRYEIVIILT